MPSSASGGQKRKGQPCPVCELHQPVFFVTSPKAKNILFTSSASGAAYQEVKKERGRRDRMP